MRKIRQALTIPFRILRGIGIVAFILGGLCMSGWYISWLDDYFLWNPIAAILGLITFPLIPLAVVIEWLWHGWPKEITLYFILTLVGTALAALGFIFRNLILGRPIDDGD